MNGNVGRLMTPGMLCSLYFSAMMDLRALGNSIVHYWERKHGAGGRTEYCMGKPLLMGLLWRRRRFCNV